jgi:hypothetical protein
MTILANGRVGIGTTSPVQAVDVRGAGSGTQAIRLGYNTGNAMRSDWSVGASSASINAYDDSTSTYKTLSIQGLPLQLYSGGTFAALIDANANMVIGRTSVLDGSGGFVTAGATVLDIANPTSSTGSTQYPVLQLSFNRPSGTAIGNAGGLITFTNSAIAGTDKRLAQIAIVTGPSYTSGQLIFYTTNAGVISESGRFRHDNVMVLQGGLNFAGNTANLSYYDEGTFTPSYSAGGTGVTQSNQKGFWTRVGNRVDCWYSLNITAKGTGTGTVIISGFPFAANTNSFASGVVYFTGAAVNISSMVAWMNQGAATMTPYAVVSGTTTTFNPLAGSQMNAAHSYAGYVCYFI